MSHNAPFLPYFPSPPPPPLLLLLLARLKPYLILLLLLKHLHFIAIPLIFSCPILNQPTHIIHKTLWAAIPQPQADDEDASPEDESDGEIDPEEHSAVHHVEDLERDEEDEDEGDDGGDIGLRNEFVEER